MDIEYTVEIWQEDQQYLAEALPLDIITSGTDPQQARQALDEAVGLFLDSARQMGTLDQVLEECGYRRTDSGWISPRWIATERHHVTLSA